MRQEPAKSSTEDDRPEDEEPTLDGAFSAGGVDLTAIRWMLEKSPTERLEVAQGWLEATWQLQQRQ